MLYYHDGAKWYNFSFPILACLLTWHADLLVVSFGEFRLMSLLTGTPVDLPVLCYLEAELLGDIRSSTTVPVQFRYDKRLLSINLF